MSVTGKVRTLALWISLVAVHTVGAAPAHVLRFQASGLPFGCTTITWRDVLTFYNTTGASATVRVLGISNGSTFQANPDRIDVPPGTVVWADLALQGAWIPQNGPRLWIMHLDVPEGILVESRDEIIVGDSCVTIPVPLVSLGKTSLPVFRAAVLANEPQIYLGTDVGAKDARTNVGIYNQGQVSANAHIEVRRSCDNSVVDARDVQVPPDTILQFTGFAKGANTCAATATTPNWLRYTVITVDQPSMTYAVTLSETRNVVPGLAPEIGIAIPVNARY